MTKALLVVAMLCACGCPITHPDLPSVGGRLIHEGSIGAGQRVAYTQALGAGRVVACVDGRKPGGTEFRGHLETARLSRDAAGVTVLGRGDSWQVQANITEWRGWCELAGTLEPGDLVRLVSEVEAPGAFQFTVTLREP